MATTYKWDCNTVDVYPQENEELNVVYNVYWVVTGTSSQTDAEGNFYTARSVGSQQIPLSAENEFIPFENLTNEIVTEWTKTTMGEEVVNNIEANVQSEIDELVSPTSITMTIE